MRRALFSLLLLALLQTAVVSAAYASLGAKPSQFSASQFSTSQLRQGARSLAASDSANPANYTVTTTTLDSGTVVREYADTAGFVFAVSWSGPFLPDLRALLGEHFSTMNQQAASHPKAGRSQLTVDTPDVVIVSNGHMRAFSGKAWIPGALPAGFSTDSIE